LRSILGFAEREDKVLQSFINPWSSSAGKRESAEYSLGPKGHSYLSQQGFEPVTPASELPIEHPKPLEAYLDHHDLQYQPIPLRSIGGTVSASYR
jgi:hypothetical protein